MTNTNRIVSKRIRFTKQEATQIEHLMSLDGFGVFSTWIRNKIFDNTRMQDQRMSEIVEKLNLIENKIAKEV